MNALARCQVHTVGELLALPPAQVRAIHAIGTKTAADAIAFQETLLGRGVHRLPRPPPVRNDPPLVPDLMDSPEPVQKLALPPALRSALEQAELPTVGAVASLTRNELLGLPGIGRTRLAQVVEALHQFRAHSAESGRRASTRSIAFGSWRRGHSRMASASQSSARSASPASLSRRARSLTT